MRKKFGKFCVFFAVLACALWGCGKAAPMGPRRVVTQVDVLCLGDTQPLGRHYTDPAKMERILNYLRLLKVRNLAFGNPQTGSGGSSHITLTLSDGSRVRCHQSGNRVLVQEDGSWQKLDPEQAVGLEALLGSMPSDAVPSAFS